MSATTATPVTAKAATIKEARGGLIPERYKNMVQQGGVMATVIVLFILFTSLNSTFIEWTNIKTVLLMTVVTGIQALGLSFVIATGGIDLTPGYGMAVAGVVAAKLMASEGLGLPIWVGVVGGIAVGGLLGLINGLLIAYVKMQPMIATLAMMLVCAGAALVLTSGRTVSLFDKTGFDQIAIGELIPNVYNGFIILVVLAIVAGILMNKTVVGRYALAIGSNKEATRISGINTRRWECLAYVICGLFTGISAIIMTARLNGGNPTVGQSYEMYAIAAAVIGGTSLRGGRASIFGAVIGALTIQTIYNGLVIVGVQDQWQKVVLGLVVLVAVFIDIRRRGGEE
jgi:ribose transport system permease protein